MSEMSGSVERVEEFRPADDNGCRGWKAYVGDYEGIILAKDELDVLKKYLTSPNLFCWRPIKHR